MHKSHKPTAAFCRTQNIKAKGDDALQLNITWHKPLGLEKNVCFL